MSERMDADSPESTVAALSQPDLFRLTYATEVLKDDVWGRRVVSAKAWVAGEIPDFTQQNGFWVEKETLHTAFTGEGTLQSPLPFRVIGDIATFIRIMAAYGLHASVTDHTPQYHIVTLSPAAGDR